MCIIIQVCWWSQSEEKFQIAKLFVSEAEWFEAVWGQPRGGADSSGRAACRHYFHYRQRKQRIHVACRSFPMWWQDGLRDGSYNPPLQLLWQRWKAWSSGGCVSWERLYVCMSFKFKAAACMHFVKYGQNVSLMVYLKYFKWTKHLFSRDVYWAGPYCLLTLLLRSEMGLTDSFGKSC